MTFPDLTHLTVDERIAYHENMVWAYARSNRAGAGPETDALFRTMADAHRAEAARLRDAQDAPESELEAAGELMDRLMRVQQYRDYFADGRDISKILPEGQGFDDFAADAADDARTRINLLESTLVALYRGWLEGAVPAWAAKRAAELDAADRAELEPSTPA